jgi:predicted GIY-YIG superfamily endonuclease
MEICYLIAFPDSHEGNAPAPEQFKGLIKDAPYFQPTDIDLVTLGEETIVIEGYAVATTRQRFDDRVQMIECHFDLKDPFASSVLSDRIKIQNALQSRYIPESFRRSGLFEEYSILLVQEAKPTPDKWIEKNSLAIANFIRSQRDVFDKEEVNEILTSRTRYSASELTLIDWEGSVIIAPNADYQSDIALLKIGNYQLLRYRMLDASLEQMLDKINEAFFLNRRRPRPTRDMIRQIAEHRLEVMLGFERAEQNMLLIGDWYTSKLYEAIQNEFYLKDWKESVRSKLDNLENIVQTIKDNLSVSWENLMDRIQLALWILMLFGYLYLYFLDAGWLTIPAK